MLSMENESTEGRTLSLDLPAALDQWLTERAAETDVDRSELVVQLLGSYRTAADVADEESVEALEAAIDDGAVDVDAAARQAADEAVTAAVPDEAALADRVTEQVMDRVEGRLDEVEAEREEQLEDVRRRVIQVKKEADSKAPADHGHPELESVDRLATELESLRAHVDEVEAAADGADEAEALASDLDDVQAKLTQLARIVVRLQNDDDGDDALTEIKRTAAREGYEAAACGACGESVSVALLPEAACPHCRSPFGGIVAGSGSLFGSKPRLVGPHDQTEADRTDGGADTGGGGGQPSDGDADLTADPRDDGQTDGAGEEVDSQADRVTTDGGNDE
jgi:predicted Zn-ribbon and HTH transcriptional regulator